MSDDEINEAISYHASCTHPGTPKGGPGYWNGKQWARKCPDYVNNLDAMHRAEKSLSDRMYDAYLDELVSVCVRVRYVRINSSTARQRAEAFLRTIGKWKEEA